MKLSEKIKENDEIRDLLGRRVNAVRKLHDLEEQDEVRIGLEWSSVSFDKGTPVFDAAQTALVERIHEVNEQLRAKGIEIDLADDDTGYDEDDDSEDEGDEDEEAA